MSDMSNLPINTAALRKLALAATQGDRVAYEKAAYDEFRVYIKAPGSITKLELFKGGFPGENAKADCEYIAATAPATILALLDELEMHRAAVMLKSKPRAPRKPKAPADPLAEFFVDVDPQVAADFRALRIKHRAPITETAMKGLQREAERAGLTFEQALVICCERGWRSLRADWLAREQAEAPQGARGPARQGKFDPVAHVNQGSMPPPGDWFDGIIDITPR